MVVSIYFYYVDGLTCVTDKFLLDYFKRKNYKKILRQYEVFINISTKNEYEETKVKFEQVYNHINPKGESVKRDALKEGVDNMGVVREMGVCLMKKGGECYEDSNCESFKCVEGICEDGNFREWKEKDKYYWFDGESLTPTRVTIDK